ncbi:MAG: hypothetical protein R3183_06800 [Oleiphilaceae bacterium]|nr:hypothetical protein [Oleiphilaceae bacterium]
MHTHDVIKLSEMELVAHLKTMDLAEMEGHARAIVLELGSENYGGLMTRVMQCVKEGGAQHKATFIAVQATIKDFLPHEAYKSDIYARLAAIMMTIIARRFRDLYAVN